ncbi:type II toxin-antitoxin system HicA family toxin [Candidatus Magnetominusculus dajiuhuensis]|uniref:type II toxin-antitoxin system HicA family toxin n=1 Tax=Candidatus Magnetominusculus dajiuhuensis TaxID=3137712 RepID=UPI003B433192
MPRLTPESWKTLECIFVNDGFVFSRQDGSHRAYIKKGILRPVVIPTYKSIGTDIIISNMRTAKMTRERYYELLDICKKRA